jgi:hypothetical protein
VRAVTDDDKNPLTDDIVAELVRAGGVMAAFVESVFAIDLDELRQRCGADKELFSLAVVCYADRATSNVGGPIGTAAARCIKAIAEAMK